MAEVKPKRELTINQKKAVQHRNHNILVSASAGSGKTTVLVERVIQKVLAVENPTSVDQMLIVTFTEAAASEMAERLEKKLNEAIAEAPIGSSRQQALQTQLERLPAADISTLHSFALHLIENYYHVIDLDPQFRLLGDETETNMMKSDVMDQVFEALYAEILEPTTDDLQVNDFAYLVELFSNDRTDIGLREVVLQLFAFANARPDFDAWLNAQAMNFADWQTPFMESTLFKEHLQAIMQKELQAVLDTLQDGLTALQDYAGTGEDLGQIAQGETDFVAQKSHAEQENTKEAKALTIRYQQLQGEYQQIQLLANELQAENSSLTKLRSLATQLTWPKIVGRPQDVNDIDARAAMDIAKEQRKYASKLFIKFVNNYLLLDEDSYQVATKGIYQAIQDLVTVVQRFNVAFSAYKRKKKVLDFNDLEHFALEILKDEATRTTIQSRYEEVMVDEYQDINPLQETLLQSVSNGHNMFMVGDIKQSIYGFRLADPDLFGHKYKYEYQPWTDEKITVPDKELIVLPENFRSHQLITEFINMIFGQIMNEELGDVDYSGAAHLEPRVIPSPGDMPPNIELMVYVDETAEGSTTTQVLDETEAEATLPDSEMAIDDKATAQLRLITAKIKALMAELGPQPGDDEAMLAKRLKLNDIAILEPTRNLNLKLVDVFKEAGIPIVVNDAGNYFQTVEINVMMSLLQIIDNPNQDIPLVAVLRSPIVGLGENELAYIRAQEKTGNYYVAVTKFMQANADSSKITTELISQQIYEKLTPFFDQLANWRILATQNQLVELIWQIYEDTGYLEYVAGMPGGAQRQANLHALYDRAATFAQSSYIGLFSFIKYIEQLRKKDKDLDSLPIETSSDAVRLMTIHAAKGQEFDIVFLLDTTHTFRTSELTNPLLIDNEYGITMPYFDPKHRVQMDVPRQAFVRQANKVRLWSESLRLLYVALTRAKKRLYLVGAYQNTNSVLNKWYLKPNASQLFIDTATRLKATNFMDWIGLALTRHPKFYQAEYNDFYQDIANDSRFDDVKLATKHLLSQLDEHDKRLFTSEFKLTKYQIDDVQNLKEQVSVAEQSEQLEQPATIITSPTELVTVPSFVSSDLDQYKQTLTFKYPHMVATQTTAYQSVSEVKRLFEDPDNIANIQLDARGFVVNDSTDTAANRYLNNEFATPNFLNQTSTKPSSLAIGSATHLVLQTIDLSQSIDEDIIKSQIEQLVVNRAIEQPVAQAINVANLTRLFTTSFGKSLTNPTNQVYREVPFSMLIPATQLYDNFSGGDERVLIHGIMDGYFRQADGTIVLFDYKTDHVKDDTELLDRYVGQLNLYAQALAQIEKVSVTQIKKVLFGLNHSRILEIKN